MTTTPTPLSVAIDYLSAGLCVVPVFAPDHADKARAGKAPVVKEWQKKRLTAEEFERALPKDGNIGVVTGKASGIICIDIDPRNGGMDWLYAHEDDLGNCIKETTGSGGVHLYYRYPEGREAPVPSWSSDGALFPGVEVLADGGHQVVTWPSVHQTGGEYEIQNGLKLTDVPHECDAPPKWLMDLIDAPRASKKPVAEDLALTDNEVDVEEYAREVSRLPPARAGEGGDRRTFKTAALGRDYALTQETCFRVLKKIYNPRCSPPWSDDALREKVRNAYKYATGQAGGKSVNAIFPPPGDASAEPPPPAPPKDPPGPKYLPKQPVVSARTYIARHKGKVLCSQEQLYVYRDAETRWAVTRDEEFESVLLRDIASADPKVAEIITMQQLANIRKAVKLETTVYGPLNPDTWLGAPHPGDYVSCKNGIVNIKTGEVLPHSPEWFSFTVLPFSYDPTARCPEFLGFLQSVWDNDEELKRSLQLWMGYILIQPRKEQKIGVLIGKSRGGKGTLSRVMMAMIGEQNTASCSIMEFGNTFGLEPLLGKKLAVFADAEQVAGKEVQVATERIKCISGNDPVTVNIKGRGMMTNVRLAAKIVLVCNEMPLFMNKGNSFTNRIIAFPFQRSFQGREDLELEDRLTAELPGILNWALDGARALLAGERLTQSKAGDAEVEEIATMLDSVRGFIAEAVHFTDNPGRSQAFISNTRLFEAYRKWCLESGAMPKGKIKFLREFASRAGNQVVKDRTPDLLRTKGFFGVSVDEDGVRGFPDHESEDEEHF